MDPTGAEGARKRIIREEKQQLGGEGGASRKQRNVYILQGEDESSESGGKRLLLFHEIFEKVCLKHLMMLCIKLEFVDLIENLEVGSSSSVSLLIGGVLADRKVPIRGPFPRAIRVCARSLLAE